MNKTKEFFNEKAKIWDLKEKRIPEFFENFVKTYIPIEKGMKVLDLACGTGVLTNAIYNQTQANVLGMDLSDEMIKIANSKNANSMIKFVEQDFYQSKLSGFDAIVVHNAYPHFTDVEGFKYKCLETLNPGGLLIICHSSSRKHVNEIHSSPSVIHSNVLLPVDAEYELYKDRFDLIQSKDDEELYLMVLRKRYF